MADQATFVGVGSGGSDSMSTGSGEGAGQGVMTERVQALASSVYREFAQVVNQYGEGPVASIMPIVITVLESLDGALSDLGDSQRALEEATEDNEQLHAQYDKEKQMRREEQIKRMRNEDQGEDERRELKQQIEQLGTNNRLLKTQLNASKERSDRTEEKNEKLKHDVMDLQVKFRRISHALSQKNNLSMVRPRTSSGNRTMGLPTAESPSATLLDPPQVIDIAAVEMATVVQDPRSVGLVSGQASIDEGASVSSAVRHQPVADELMEFQPPVASSPVLAELGHRPLRKVTSPLAMEPPLLALSLPGDVDAEGSETETVRSRSDTIEEGLAPADSDDTPSVIDDIREEVEDDDVSSLHSPQSKTMRGQSVLGESLESELMQASKSMEEVIDDDEQEAGSEEDLPTAEDALNQVMSDETIAAPATAAGNSIVQTGDGESAAASPTKHSVPENEPVEQATVEEPEPGYPVEPVAEVPRQLAVEELSVTPTELPSPSFSRRPVEGVASISGSVHTEEEMIVVDCEPPAATSRPATLDAFGNGEGVVEAADLSAVSSPESMDLELAADDLDEVERLMERVRDLEHALDQQTRDKEDFSGQLVGLNEDRDRSEARIEQLQHERSMMQTRLRALEAELRERSDRLEELEKEVQANQEPLFPGATDNENWAVSQKRQYSRVEMARLLRERNEFKERYLSLKEKLQIQQQRQQEMPTPKKKEKTLWKMFSDMFKGKAKAGSAPRTPISTRFAGTKSEESLPLASSDSTLNAPGPLTLAVGRRFEAYGWSLPEAMAPRSMTVDGKGSSGGSAKGGKRGSSVVEVNRLDSVPVLMHCGHLIMESHDQFVFSSPRTWCAAAVCSTVQSNPSLHPSDMVCPASLVWVCTGTSELSRVNVLDANMPGEIIDTFPVCSSPILCIASVPGVEDDESMIHIASATEDSSILTPTDLDQYRYRSPAVSPPLQISPDHFIDGVRQAGAALASGSPQEKVISLKEAFQDSPTPTRREHSGSMSGEAMARPRLRLPTMWMGAEFGCLYIHSAVSSWRSCLHAMKVEASVLSIVYAQQKVFVAMANSGLAIFKRIRDEWDWEGYKILYLGPDRDVPISVMVTVKHRVWCGVANKVYVVNANTNEVETHFKVHPSLRSRVLSMVTSGDGVWVSVRLDSTLRLFHADTFQNLQDVDVAKPIQTLLTFPGSKRKPSPRNLVRISTLLISNNCLWIGATNGTIVSVPLTSVRPVEGHETPRGTNVSSASFGSFSIVGEDVTATSGDDSIAMAMEDGAATVPYLSLDSSRLSFHGHVHNVDVLVATPGVMATRTVQVSVDGGSSAPKRVSSASVTFVTSVGGGYVDFRSDSTSPVSGGTTVQSADRNHLIVWQVSPGGNSM